MAQQQIQVFGAPWCPDCKQSKQFLNEQRVAYEWKDIDQDEEAASGLHAWEGSMAPPLHIYESGSWGPEAAETLLVEDGRAWLQGHQGNSGNHG